MAEAIRPTREMKPPQDRAEGWWAQQELLSRCFYWGVHASCLFALWVGVSSGDLALCAATFFVRMFGITGGYHRYFSHKTYKTSRPFQFALAVLGASSVQKGPIWWASHHRNHHRYSDQPGKDPHSPREGFWHAHQGWIFDGSTDESDLEQIRDFSAYPELMALNRWHIVPPVLLALSCLAIGGWSGLVWGFAISTVLLWHSTYAINSLAHRLGTRRYETGDDSRNHWFLGLLTMGEGWHNNHHHYCGCARQGFFWWEIDVTYYILRGLQAVGLIWDVREPPAHAVNASIENRLRDAA